ncbi:hypothetical protein Dvar_15480 [Desulfosarcina variabilis str. Montpellier]|uniref:substrate-binding domain-containing protein n=1 Tax=Desulfosarcina variabilis TaxID=2300 RepID=UPI003AFAA4D7
MDKRVIIYRIVIVAQALWLVVGLATIAHGQYGRNTIRIVGSSTVYPFARLVAKTFAETTSFKQPAIESTGSGGGFGMFCSSKPSACSAPCLGRGSSGTCPNGPAITTKPIAAMAIPAD